MLKFVNNSWICHHHKTISIFFRIWKCQWKKSMKSIRSYYLEDFGLFDDGLLRSCNPVWLGIIRLKSWHLCWYATGRNGWERARLTGVRYSASHPAVQSLEGEYETKSSGGHCWLVDTPISSPVSDFFLFIFYFFGQRTLAGCPVGLVLLRHNLLWMVITAGAVLHFLSSARLYTRSAKCLCLLIACWRWVFIQAARLLSLRWYISCSGCIVFV